MAAYTVCGDPKCATLVEGKADACPKCGGTMKSVGESPWRGILLLLCGLFLIGLMGAILYNMYPTLTHPGDTIGGSTFTGTADQARSTLLLFAAVIVFGLVATANGVYMLVTRQQSKVFVFATLGIAAILLIIAFVTMGKLKDPEEAKPVQTESGF